jgi:hypothetical protein
MPGFAFPSVGPLGLGSPPSRSGDGTPDLRYYAKLRLPSGPSRVASLLARFSLPCASSSVCVPFPARSQAEAPPSARSFVPPVHLVLRLSPTRRPMALPSSRVTPMKTCPALRPRWCPERIALARSGLLPSTPLHGVGFPPPFESDYPNGPRPYRFRGSITRPAFSLPPAPYTPLLESHAPSLLTGWLGFSQVGLEPHRPSPTG